MKNYYTLRLIVTAMTIMMFAHLANAMGTITFTVHGVVKDETTHEPVAGVIVSLHDGSAGTVTDEKGRWSLEVTTNDERGLIDFSYVGYEKKTLSVANDGKDVTVTMRISQVMTREVVVSASRIPERLMESPVTVEKITSRDIKETPAQNFYESVANLKSVDIVTSGIAFKTINIRGFGNTEKPGFVQLVDGMDNQSPGLSYSVGYNINDLDVDNVEIIPGTASALYGANAFNGIMNVTSKNPFKYQGISVQMKTGVNHVDGIDHNPAPLTNLQIRVAKALNSHLAFKINGEYFQGQDWAATDATDVSLAQYPGSEGIANPAYDGLNVYGDEVNAPLPIGANGSPIVVSRSGYREKDLINYNSSYVKYDAALHYRFNDKVELSYVYKGSTTNSILHSGSRYQFKDFGLSQQKIELKAPQFFVRAYMTGENSGKSFDSRFLAINMNEAWKSSNDWFTEYAMAYMGAIPDVAPGDFNAARAFADAGRPMPGTEAFNTLKNEVANKMITEGGASFDEHSKLYNAETQYNFSKEVKFVELLAGANVRYYNLNSNGSLYADGPGRPALSFYETGTYAQVGKKLMDDKLKLTASLRYDKSENYEGQFSPRFSAVLKTGRDNFVRASYQTGYRMPTAQDQYMDLNLGFMRVLGGLPGTVNPYGIVGKAFTLESVTDYGNGVTDYINNNPTDSMAVYNAVEQNKSKLKAIDYNYVKPEHVQTFEVGYKGVFNDSKLFYDLSMYYSVNRDFIGYQNVVRPQTGGGENADSITAAAWSIIDPSQTANAYQLTVNLPGNVNTYGVALSMSYNLPSNFVLSGNVTYSHLDKAPEGRTMFNTPAYKTNIGFSNRNVYKNLGFAINWRWADSYLWESLFGDGMLKVANTLDAQLSYSLPKVNTTIKLGATNALNYRRTDVYGGGTLGGIYYVSLRYDGLFDKKN